MLRQFVKGIKKGPSVLSGGPFVLPKFGLAILLSLAFYLGISFSSFTALSLSCKLVFYSTNSLAKLFLRLWFGWLAALGWLLFFKGKGALFKIAANGVAGRYGTV